MMERRQSHNRGPSTGGQINWTTNRGPLTAVLSIFVFYSLNGVRLTAPNEAIIGLAVDTAESLLGVDGIAAVLKDWTKRS